MDSPSVRGDSGAEPAPDAAAEPPDAMLMSSPGVSSLFDPGAGVVGVGVAGLSAAGVMAGTATVSSSSSSADSKPSSSSASASASSSSAAYSPSSPSEPSGRHRSMCSAYCWIACVCMQYICSTDGSSLSLSAVNDRMGMVTENSET